MAINHFQISSWESRLIWFYSLYGLRLGWGFFGRCTISIINTLINQWLNVMMMVLGLEQRPLKHYDVKNNPDNTVGTCDPLPPPFSSRVRPPWLGKGHTHTLRLCSMSADGSVGCRLLENWRQFPQHLHVGQRWKSTTQSLNVKKIN